MSDDEQPDDDTPTRREAFLALLGGGVPAEAAEDVTVGSIDTKTVYLDFDVHDHIQIDYNGTRYEIVEQDGGLAVVEADE